MKRRGPASVWIGTMLVALLLPTLPPRHVVAQVASAADTDGRRRLQEIQQERSQLREEMIRIRSRVSDLSAELSNLDRQVNSAADLVGELDAQLAQREAQIGQNTYELLTARDRLTERRAILHRRLRDIYKRGPLHAVEVLLASESFSDLLNRYKYLFLIARHDRRLAAEVSDLERQLVARERGLRRSIDQLERLRDQRSLQREALEALLSEHRAALGDIEARGTATAERIAQLEQDEERLANLLVDLDRDRQAPSGVGIVDASTRPRETEIPSISPGSIGSLEWPVDGTIAYRFGRVPGPDGSVIVRSGMGITARPGSPVRAVAAGTIVSTEPFGGYGRGVIVSHGGGYYTLYLYLGEVHVEEGDAIQAGQTIATVGAGDGTAGPHIEFQLRLPGGNAVDPLPWLRRR